MPRVIITETAVQGLQRCRAFLESVAPDAAARAAHSIGRHFRLLEMSPDIGRRVPDVPELRELLIPFGNTGYVALYRHEPDMNTVYILAFRHQKEAGY